MKRELSLLFLNKTSGMQIDLSYICLVMQMVDALQGVVLFFCKSCLVKRLNTHIHASVSSSCICIVHSTVFKTYNRRARFSFVTGIIQVSTTFPLYVNYNQSSPIKNQCLKRKFVILN